MIEIHDIYIRREVKTEEGGKFCSQECPGFHLGMCKFITGWPRYVPETGKYSRLEECKSSQGRRGQ